MTKKEELRHHPRFASGVKCTHCGWHMGRQRIRFDGQHLEVPDAAALIGSLSIDEMYARYEGTNIELVQREPGLQQFVVEFEEEREASLWKDFLTQAAKDYAKNDQDRLLQLRTAIKKQETVLKALGGLVADMEERKSGLRNGTQIATNGDNGREDKIILLNGNSNAKEVTTTFTKSAPTPSIQIKEPPMKASSELPRRFQRTTPTTSEAGSVKSIPSSLPSAKERLESLARSKSSERGVLETQSGSDAGAPEQVKGFSGSSLLQKIAATKISKDSRPDKSQGQISDSVSPWQRLLSKRGEDKDGSVTPSSQQASSTPLPETSKPSTMADKSKLNLSLKTFGSRLTTSSAESDSNNSEPSTPWQRMLDRRQATPTASEPSSRVDTARSQPALSPVPEKRNYLQGLSTARTLTDMKRSQTSGGDEKLARLATAPEASVSGSSLTQRPSGGSLTQRVTQRIATMQDASNK